MCIRDRYQRRVHGISDPGQMKIFELSLQKESKVFIEVIPCIGEVEFSVSKTLNSAYSQDALELRASELKRGRIFGSLKAVPGVHFVTVRGIAKSTSLKEFNEGIQFTIRTIISNAEDESELEDFTLENYGTITFELQSNELKLSWGRVFQRSRGNSLPVEAKYSVYMSEDSSANFQTICGIKYSRAKMIAKNLTSTSVTYKIKDKRKDKRLGFNVIAQLPQHSQSVAYTPVFLQVPNSSSLSKSYIVATIMIIIALGGLAFYFYMKFRTMKSVLEYEMTDARNMTQIVTSRDIPSSRADRYSCLLYTSRAHETSLHLVCRLLLEKKKKKKKKNTPRWILVLKNNKNRNKKKP
eukprot:TRINITY_DN4919_c0_g1_i5.p1 TRINITY_DN4919_c0_g1~~TRINITY_DN4919_c0_g1_i5.p1  ORF type:complete len:353 (+),score=71.30 TRINITY_DN4919_c0_g1_i5:155-1213(+)